MLICSVGRVSRISAPNNESRRTPQLGKRPGQDRGRSWGRSRRSTLGSGYQETMQTPQGLGATAIRIAVRAADRARAAVRADFRMSVASTPARPRLASPESADLAKSPHPPWLSLPRHFAVRWVSKGAATPPTSTTAAGPRRYALRWPRPSSARPARPAACLW
jgi:hypothetical protein